MLGENVKIHFAGSDGGASAYAALVAAGVRYRLYSCFSFIDKKSVDDNFTLPENSIIKIQDKEANHVIQDSGLFTLMFGAGKNRKIDHNYLVSWQDKLIKFVLQNRLSCTCVEIDCQKLLGVDEAWWFRKRMRNLLPNKQINVFHYEDGKDGFDRLIDFSDYIAISVPELRIVKPKKYKAFAVQLARYAKRKKPNIDIHMLGCTEYSMLRDISFCTSADSTSWLSGVKYGYFSENGTKGHISQIRTGALAEREAKIKLILNDLGVAINDNVGKYTAVASICASIARQKYSELAGPQD